MPVCKYCESTETARTHRNFREKLAGCRVVYACTHCGRRNFIYHVKNCWRCGTDLDRRRRETLADRMASVALLWPYSCRRCGKRRYRWGKHSG